MTKKTTTKAKAPAKPKALQTSAEYYDYDNVFDADLTALVAFVGNPRKNDHVVQSMADVIEAHGFRIPIMIKTLPDDQYEIVDGHLRVKAARLLGMDTVPAYLVDDMDEAQIALFRVAVNKASELADWDSGKLRELLAQVKAEDEDISRLTLIGETDLTTILAEEKVQLPDDPKPAKAGTTKSKAADKSTVTNEDDMVTLSLTLTSAQREDMLGVLAGLVKEGTYENNSQAAYGVVMKTSEPPAKAKPRSRKKS